MSSDNWDPALFELVQRKHPELTELLAKIRDALSAHDRTKNQVDDYMSRLCEIVQAHFSHEEEGGYMKEVLEQSPGHTMQARNLLDQHEVLANDVEKLRLLTHSGFESPAWWCRIHADFHKFVSQLLRHEGAETEVFQQVSTQNFGGGD